MATVLHIFHVLVVTINVFTTYSWLTIGISSLKSLQPPDLTPGEVDTSRKVNTETAKRLHDCKCRRASPLPCLFEGFLERHLLVMLIIKFKPQIRSNGLSTGRP